MTLLSPNHNYAADECIAQIPQHHIPTAGEKVRASESFDKGVLVAAHMAALHDAYIMEMATHPVNEVTIKPASPTSSVGGLKPSTLKQLKIGKVHRRRVLHGTLCMKTLCTKGLNGLVAVNVFEDEEGNATPIYMSNAMEGNGGSAQAQQLYPQDSKVAVKEPYLTRLPDGEVVLLVEKTTDLVFLWVPDYVEESETTSGGTKGNGLHEKNGADERSVGRDAFTMDKGSEQDGSSTGGDYADVEDKVEEADPVEKAEGNGDLKEDVVRRASASRGLKFEDMEKMGRGKCEGGEEGEKEAVGLDEEGQEVSREFTSEDVLAMRNGGQHEVEEADSKEGQDNLEKLEKVVESQENVAEQGQREIAVAGLRENTVEQGERDEEVAELPENRQDIASESGGDNEESEVQVEARTVEQLDDPWETAAELAQLQENIAEQGEGEVEVAELPENAESGGDNEECGVEAEAEAEAEARRVELLDDPWETAASLRAKGNALFARGEFAKAADMYTRAIDKARQAGQKAEEVLSVSNRAEVWLRLARNQKALEDAEAAIRLLEGGVSAEAAGELAKAKALFRKGRALMGLRKYGEAMSVLQEVLVRAPADRQLREAAMKCRDRVRQALKPGKRQRAAANRKKKSSTQK